MKLLLIEDDASLMSTLSRTLSRRGWQVSSCADGALAIQRWEDTQPDVVALDLTLPHLDGLEILTLARERRWTTPVLILTARGTVGDRVIGLNTGADDYLAKPFDLDELEARLKALLRRSQTKAAVTLPMHSAGVLQIGQLFIDPESGAAHYQGQVLDLPQRELKMLTALMHKAGRAVAKDKLFELVFTQDTDVNLEAIEVVAYRLRKKLQGTGVSLVTLRGLGYLIKEDN